MSSLLSTTDICNLALDYLNETPLVSFDSDTGAVAQWFRRNFWQTAWGIMRRHPWNFATARVQLAASGTAPAFGWSYAYDLPTDPSNAVLRVLPLTIDGTDNGKPIPFKVEGTQIFTDAPAPLNVRYIKRVTNPGAFDTSFADVLSAALAQRLAHWMTGKQSMAQLMGQTASALMLEAQGMDSLEGIADDPDDGDWISWRQ